MSQVKQYVKVSLYLKKIPEISDEQFHHHWKGQHVEIAMRNKTFTEKVRKYNQVRRRVVTRPSPDTLVDGWPNSITSHPNIESKPQLSAYQFLNSMALPRCGWTP